MGNIVLLDESLSNKIAAGEVVERPASVVKELVENAIDAKSSHITIEVEEGGLSKIRIVDNGIGIEPEDCEKAFLRHATSKIKHERDLFRIKTLGFRGEALPSIASVSRFTIMTSTGENEGTMLKLEGGQIIERKAHSLRKGTEMIVNDLFYNTPARLKYMKTIHTELGHITDVINRLALAHPDISFHLSHNGKRVFHTSGNGDLLQVIAQIYGFDVAKKMIPLHLESLDFTIDGYIAKPEVTRASRNYMSTLVNGRFIKNYPIVKAILEGYHTLLPIGRYPMCVLTIKMDPILVDVNVHPAKLEVRFSKEAELNELITEGIKERFRQLTLIPSVSEPKQFAKKTVQQALSFHEHERAKLDILPEKRTTAEPAIFVKDSVQIHESPMDEKWMSAAYEVKEETTDREEPVDEYQETTEVQEEKSNSRIPTLYPIGQMHGTYILAENEQGLYIIDQHAAQERINFEYYREKLANPKKELQDLLIPLTFEFTHDEVIKIQQAKAELSDAGILLEPFGNRTFVVKHHPTWFPKGEEESLIREMIDYAIENTRVDLGKFRESAAAMMSCKASIKANQHLRMDEMVELLETLRKMSDPFTCPHGRPIIIHFSTYEMERMFKRIM